MFRSTNPNVAPWVNISSPQIWILTWLTLHLGLAENRPAKPLNPMVNDHYPYEKWLFHWEYTQHFQTYTFFDAFDGHKKWTSHALPVALKSAAQGLQQTWELPRFGQWNGKHRSKWHQSEVRLGISCAGPVWILGGNFDTQVQKKEVDNVASRKSRISVSKSISVSILENKLPMRYLSSSIQNYIANGYCRNFRSKIAFLVSIVSIFASRDFQHTKRGCDASPRCSVAERAVAPSDPEVSPASAKLCGMGARYGLSAVEHGWAQFYGNFYPLVI